MVAQVDEVLPVGEGGLAHLAERHHGLDPAAVAGLQAREAELAGVAQVHDPTGEADRDAGRRVRFELPVAGAHGRDRVGDGHRDRVGAAAEARRGGVQPLALGQAHGLLLGDLVGDLVVAELGDCVVLAHGSPSAGCDTGGPGQSAVVVVR